MNPKLPPDPGLDEALGNWAANTAAPPVSQAEADQLVERAQQRRGLPMGGIALAAVSLFAVGVLGVGALSLLDGQQVGEDAITAPPEAVVVMPYSAVITQERGGDGRIGNNRLQARQDVLVARVDHDRLGLAPGTTVHVKGPPDSRVLLLDKGRLAVAAAARGETDALTVSVGDLVVRVIGTQFEVTQERDSVRVAVAEGQVRVHHGPEAWTLTSGQALEWNPVSPVVRPVQVMAVMQLLELPVERVGSEPKTAPNPVAPWNLAEVKQQVVSGNLEAAIAALKSHLSQKPGDALAWSLLGDAHRRDGANHDAVLAWQQAAKIAEPAAAARDRFKAAGVLAGQGQWEPALSLYQQVLDGEAGALALDARLGKGRCQLEQGLTDEGRATLQTLSDEHPGSTQAKQALVLLGR